MAIEFNCPHCGHAYRLKDELAGQTVACKNCRQRFTVPAPAGAPHATVPTEEELATLPRWARVAFVARCARRALPLFKHSWPQAPARHVHAVAKAVSAAEDVAAGAATSASTATASAVAAISAARAAASALAPEAASAARAAARAATDAACGASTVNDEDTVIASAPAAADIAVRFDFTALRDRARAEGWTDDTPVPPTAFGPMWPFGAPKDWPPEEPGARLVATIAPPPGATAEQIADFQVRLYEALNKLALANGGAGLKLDSFDRDVPALVLAGKGE